MRVLLYHYHPGSTLTHYFLAVWLYYLFSVCIFHLQCLSPFYSFSVLPKPDGGIRLIHYGSQPAGASMNDRHSLAPRLGPITLTYAHACIALYNLINIAPVHSYISHVNSARYVAFLASRLSYSSIIQYWILHLEGGLPTPPPPGSVVVPSLCSEAVNVCWAIAANPSGR